MHIRNLKHALKYVHRLIKFNQNVQQKPYIGMDADLKKRSK